MCVHDGHWRVAYLAKCVPSMYNTMNLIHRIHIKKEKACMVLYTCNVSAGKVETGRFLGLTNQVA